MVDSWHTYPKIFNVGHSALTDLLADAVVVEEKVDGSQFSFGIFDGVVKARSKGQELIIDAPEKMFNKAIEVVLSLSNALIDGWTYRAEYLQKPKHNALAYDRVPEKHLMLFDINTGHEQYLDATTKAVEAKRLGLEVVPCLHDGILESFEQVMALVDRVSVLGGQKCEGVVIKNYARFGRDGKALMGKHVTEAFKEVHRNDWKKSNPTNKDIMVVLCDKYHSKARWQKAIQHLKERGEITNSPKDIGPLLREAQNDIALECEEEIKQALYDWAKPHILRGAIAGLPQWYKDELLGLQFEKEPV